MRPCFVRTAAPLFVALSLVACDRDVTPPARVHSVNFLRPTAQATAPSSQPASDLFGLRVDADEGVSDDVQWSSSDTTIAKVDAEGLLHVCSASSTVTITATSVSDPAKSATANPIFISNSMGWLGITAITNAATGQQVDLLDARADVRLRVEADARWLDCTGLARLELLAVPAEGGAALPVADLTFTPPRRTLVESVPWRTTSVPNGHYVLEARAYFAGRAGPASTMPLTTVRVVN